MPKKIEGLRFGPHADDGAARAADLPIAARLHGLSGTEIARNLDEKQKASATKALLSEKERAPAWDSGFNASQARFAIVAASEHFEGREKAALGLLANPKLSKLSGAELADMLGEMPYAGNAEVLAAIRANNPDLGNEGNDGVSAKSNSQTVWDRAIARNNPVKAAHAKLAEPRA